MNAGTVAADIRRLRRAGLKESREYADAVAMLDWLSAPYVDPSDACMSCYSPLCSVCLKCHECGDEEIVAESHP